MNIKEIFLRKLDNTINPKVARVLMLGLFSLGTLMIGMPAFIGVEGTIQYKNEGTSVQLSIRDHAQGLSQILGAGMIILSVVLFIFDRLRPETVLHKPKNLKEASFEINKLLIQNKELFSIYYPDSSAGSTEPNRDVDLWIDVRNQKIQPNNQRILEILNSIIPEKPPNNMIVNNMINHLVAFEAHISNPDIDYSTHQFPKDFPELISRLCNESLINFKKLDPIKIFINEWRLTQPYQIEEAHLFGSCLYLSIPRDFDLLFIIKASSLTDHTIYTTGIKNLKETLARKFHRPLHVTAFTTNEIGECDRFLKTLQNTYKI